MPSVSARVTEPILYKELAMMFRWVFFAIVAVLLVSWLFSMRLPWLEKLGLTKLNGNLTFRAFGKVRRIPVTYVVLLATAAYLAVALLYK
jgi:hypothetical protein